jgi:ribosome-binding factor A
LIIVSSRVFRKYAAFKPVALVSPANLPNYAGFGEASMKPQTAKGPSQRQLRAGELLKHALAEIFMTEEIEDSDLHGEIISVAEVRVSPDLKHATVFIAALGGKNNEQLARVLNRHHRFLRGELARRVELKYSPELVFRGDHSVEAADRIDELLRSPSVVRDLK